KKTMEYLYSFGNESWWVSLIGGEKTKKRSGGSDYRRWMGPILIGGNTVSSTARESFTSRPGRRVKY
ncbi:MAG: hypothetical protein KKF02_05885, partial [Proteobacteria bacterium]|nr:hypothetical protein [Pseudomonadota bacterium]